MLISVWNNRHTLGVIEKNAESNEAKKRATFCSLLKKKYCLQPIDLLWHEILQCKIKVSVCTLCYATSDHLQNHILRQCTSTGNVERFFIRKPKKKKVQKNKLWVFILRSPYRSHRIEMKVRCYCNTACIRKK